MNDCSFVHENAAAHAIDALDVQESVRIDRHVAACPPCARVVGQIRTTIGLLPFVVPQVAPPPRVKQALFAQVAQLSTNRAAPTFPVDHQGRTLSLPPSTVTPLPARGESTKPALVARPRRFRPSWEYLAAPLAAVPLMFALAIVGGWAFTAQADLRDRANEVKQLKTANQTLTQQLDDIALTLPESTAQRITLDPVASNTQSSASYLLASPNDNAVTVVLRKLAEPGPFKVICESKDGQVIELGDIQVNSDGYGANSWRLPMPAGRLRSVHVQPSGETDNSLLDTYVTGDVLRADMEDNLGADDGTAASTNSH